MNSVDKLRVLENAMRIATRTVSQNQSGTGGLYNPSSTINIEEVKRIYNELIVLLNE